mmetsp:Transcript_27350/g.84772  ORF Transcript_27350/g.84772 Transcript_27350/m.84772 type:complete len:220 (+) Transcript_27350:169-828(+)
MRRGARRRKRLRGPARSQTRRPPHFAQTPQTLEKRRPHGHKRHPQHATRQQCVPTRNAIGGGNPAPNSAARSRPSHRSRPSKTRKDSCGRGIGRRKAENRTVPHRKEECKQSAVKRRPKRKKNMLPPPGGGRKSPCLPADKFSVVGCQVQLALTAAPAQAISRGAWYAHLGRHTKGRGVPRCTSSEEGHAARVGSKGSTSSDFRCRLMTQIRWATSMHR